MSCLESSRPEVLNILILFENLGGPPMPNEYFFHMVSSVFLDLAAHLKSFHGTPVEKHCSIPMFYQYVFVTIK